MPTLYVTTAIPYVITMPSWVDTYIDTRGTLDDVLTRSPVGRRTLKSDLAQHGPGRVHGTRGCPRPQ